MLTFIKSPLFKYLILAFIVCGVIFFAYYEGESKVKAEWDLDKANTKIEIAELKEKANKITTVIETRYVDRIKVVKEKGDTIVQYVPQYITQADNDACVINAGFVRVFNAAIQNELPNSADETDRRPANISLAEVAANAATNFNICNQYIEQNAGLKQWIKEQAK